jgi:hypothetical protein
MVPLVTGPPLLIAVAVKVTELFGADVKEELLLELREVVVGACAGPRHVIVTYPTPALAPAVLV